jgi:PiT family inorganic phosphate transporter
VIIPAVLSPVIAVLVAPVGTWLLYRISRMVSLAHGTNDAQKTMGVITPTLIANGTLPTKANAAAYAVARGIGGAAGPRRYRGRALAGF